MRLPIDSGESSKSRIGNRTEANIGESAAFDQFAVDIISIPKAAKRIGLSAETIYRLARSGRFEPAVRVGARWLVSVPRLEKFLHGDGTAATEPRHVTG
jgi:excisionase family DNA binding protein